MREDHRPSNEQLGDLYEAATAFKLAQPWKRLYDTQLICVEDPLTKMMGYCSVMGRHGEHFAIGVYLGDEGLAKFSQLMIMEESIPPHSLLQYQDCLMCSFENREFLSSVDRKQIKQLGLTFRGKNAWPMFRRFEPGYEPWYLNEEECIFLTHALKQVLFVVDQMLTEQLSQEIEEGFTVVRYSEMKNGQLEWNSRRHEIVIPLPTTQTVRIEDDMLIQRLKKIGHNAGSTLQVDICMLPSAVQDKRNSRPYFPRMIVLADLSTGMIIDFEMYHDAKDNVDITLHKIIQYCLNQGLPGEIQVCKMEMIGILEDICDRTGIELKLVNRLIRIEHMMNELADHFLG